MIRASLFLALLLVGCGDLERDNCRDPHSPCSTDLPQLLIGSWGRNDQERNEVLIFKDDGSVQLLDYTCYQRGPGDVIDRQASPPCHTLFGSYSLNGDELLLHFNEVYNLPGYEPISLPRTDQVSRISIRHETLTMVAEDGSRSYTPF